MNLSQKIYECRKKANLSQEALAEKIGVSRQAVSKWETGEAVPEVGKLVLLAKTFGVSTDYLLSQEEQKEDEKATRTFSSSSHDSGAWVDRIPGLLGRILHRYGWLGGVYLAVTGAIMTGMGALARYMVRRMLRPMYEFPGPMGLQNPFSANIATNNPVSIMGGAIMVLGLLLLVTGIFLALLLKKKSNQSFQKK